MRNWYLLNAISKSGIINGQTPQHMAICQGLKKCFPQLTSAQWQSLKIPGNNEMYQISHL